MLIKGERGKIGVGYSLKCPNGNGKMKYTVWVWDKNTYNGEKVKERRKLKRELGMEYRNYSRVEKWKSLGDMSDPETIQALYEHLVEVYGFEYTQDELQKSLEEQRDEMEKERLKKLDELNRRISSKCHSLGIPFKPFESIVGAQRKEKELDRKLNQK